MEYELERDNIETYSSLTVVFYVKYTFTAMPIF